MCGLTFLLPAWAHAARYALLVGVSAYPSVPGAALHGPENDVPLLRGVLLQRGFRAGDIRVLADKVVPAHGQPTRAAIIAELDALAGKAQRGDFIFLAFSGHGSRQPAKNLGPANPEPDGLDEIFLPLDVGKWSGGIGEVENSIVDDLLGEKIAAMRNRGAFVWVIFDTCHSGTITRGIDDPSVRYRDVAADALKIPEEIIAAAQARAAKMFGQTRGGAQPASPVRTAELGPDAGGFVAFYAAQSWERTPEAVMPPGDPKQRRFGVFTYTLAEVLAMNPSMTYRQAAEQVLHRYRAMLGGQPTPLFEGNALDAPVFGSRAAPQVLQWQVERSDAGLTIPAGSLHRLADGAILSLFASPGDPDGKALGFVRASNVEILQSRVAPVARAGRPAVNPDKLPDPVYARLVHPNTSLEVRVSLPAAAKRASGAEARARAQIEQMSRRKIPGLAVTWVPADRRGDIRLAVRDGRVWFLPPTGELVADGPHQNISITLDGKTPEQVATLTVDTLRSVARTVNVLRIAAMAGASAVAQSVDVRLSYERDGKRNEVRASQVPQFRRGDKIFVAVKNDFGAPVDFNALAIDARYGIDVFALDRLETGGQRVFEGYIAGDTAGRESLLVIMTEVQEGQPQADFTFLKQASLPVTRGKPGSVARLFEAAGFEPRKFRGAESPAASLSTTGLRVFSWDAVTE